MPIKEVAILIILYSFSQAITTSRTNLEVQENSSAGTRHASNTKAVARSYRNNGNNVHVVCSKTNRPKVEGSLVQKGGDASTTLRAICTHPKQIDHQFPPTPWGPLAKPLQYYYYKYSPPCSPGCSFWGWGCKEMVIITTS